jgi:hypothetical protein
MAYLAARFQPVPAEALVAWSRGERNLPSNAVVVTFDDGYEDVLT